MKNVLGCLVTLVAVILGVYLLVVAITFIIANIMAIIKMFLAIALVALIGFGLTVLYMAWSAMKYWISNRKDRVE